MRGTKGRRVRDVLKTPNPPLKWVWRWESALCSGRCAESSRASSAVVDSKPPGTHTTPWQTFSGAPTQLEITINSVLHQCYLPKPTIENIR